MLEAPAVLGGPPPQASGCSPSRPPTPGREAGAAGVCVFPSGLCTPRKQMGSRVFFGLLKLGSECSFLDISVSPWGREDGVCL